MKKYSLSFVVLSVLFITSPVFAQFNFFHGVLGLCSGSYHREGTSCVANIQNCTVSNGSGKKSWISSSSSYSACMVEQCNSGYSIYNNSCALSGIRVTSATWGTNCPNPPTGNLTNALGNSCNTKTTCSFNLNALHPSDPYAGCAKQFAAYFECSGAPKAYVYNVGEAGGRTHTISCP